MTTSVILQDQDTWEPLIGVRINAIDADTKGILDNQTTDSDGYATFDDGAFGTERYYFQPLITRDRVHMLVVSPFGYSLYGIDASEQYVDGRTGWTVMDTGAPANSKGITTDFTTNDMFHIDRTSINNAGDLYRSIDDGVSWAAVTAPAAGLSCFYIDITPAGRLWSYWMDEAVDNTTYVYYTDNAGGSWTLYDTISLAGASFSGGFCYPRAIGYDPEAPTTGGLTRNRGAGSGTRFFRDSGSGYPADDNGGVDVSTDANAGVDDGMMLFTNSNIVVCTSRATGGTQRIRLHLSTNGGTSFSQVYEKATGGDNIVWVQGAYAKPGTLFWCYDRSSGGTGTEGVLRSTDSGATWTELTLPASFRPIGILYDNELDVLWVFRSTTAYYKLNQASSVADASAVWETVTTLPTANFQASRYRNVTLIR